MRTQPVWAAVSASLERLVALPLLQADAAPMDTAACQRMPDEILAIRVDVQAVSGRMSSVLLRRKIARLASWRIPVCQAEVRHG